jgi:hypothetical protein
LKQTPTWAGRAILLFAILLAPNAGLGDDGVRSGATAYGDWRDDAPGVRRLIPPADLPDPYATPATSNPSQPSVRPASTFPKAQLSGSQPPLDSCSSGRRRGIDVRRTQAIAASRLERRRGSEGIPVQKPFPTHTPFSPCGAALPDAPETAALPAAAEGRAA